MSHQVFFQKLVDAARSDKDRPVLLALTSYIPTSGQEVRQLWDAWKSRTKDDDWWIRAMAWVYLFFLAGVPFEDGVQPEELIEAMVQAIGSEESPFVLLVLASYPVKNLEELAKLRQRVESLIDTP